MIGFDIFNFLKQHQQNDAHSRAVIIILAGVRYSTRPYHDDEESKSSFDHGRFLGPGGKI